MTLVRDPRPFANSAAALSAAEEFLKTGDGLIDFIPVAGGYAVQVSDYETDTPLGFIAPAVH